MASSLTGWCGSKALKSSAGRVNAARERTDLDPSGSRTATIESRLACYPATSTTQASPGHTSPDRRATSMSEGPARSVSPWRCTREQGTIPRMRRHPKTSPPSPLDQRQDEAFSAQHLPPPVKANDASRTLNVRRLRW